MQNFLGPESQPRLASGDHLVLYAIRSAGEEAYFEDASLDRKRHQNRTHILRAWSIPCEVGGGSTSAHNGRTVTTHSYAQL